MTMKKILSNIYTLAALLMAGTAFTACSSSDDIIEQPANPTEPQVYTMVIKATKGGNASTRALKTGTNGIDAYWIGNETMEVYQNDEPIGTATAAPSANGNTTITATFTSAPDPAYDLNFYLGGRTPDFTKQVGLLTGTNSISEKYDYAMDCLTDHSYTVNGNIVTPNDDSRKLVFGAASQAIIKFTLKDKANDALISPSALTVIDGTYEGNVSLTSIPEATYTTNGAGVLYVAFPAAGSEKTITLTATVGSDTYTYTTSSTKKFVNGLYYEITVKMTKQLGHTLTSAAVGDIIGSDGLAYAAADKDNLPSGVTAVAVITYVGEAGTADASSATYKGLALALTDANNGDEAAWCSQYSVTCLNTQYANETDAKGDMAGIANTNALLGHASHTHTAASVARNYNGGTHPTGTSEWFLPSAGQWDKMITAASGFENLRTNASLQSVNDGYSYYWSSTEYTEIGAWLCYFKENVGGWGTDDKDRTNYVRSALAF